MACIDFISSLHRRTKRDYRARVCKDDKAHCSEVARRYGKDYWDGQRRYGFGGFYYDGRWAPVAERLIEHYQLGESSRVLDVGCGKAFLLYEFKKLLPSLEVAGVDCSQYALDNAKEEVRPYLRQGSAVSLPFPDHCFDFVLSVSVLHNLRIYELEKALQEIERVGRGASYITLDSYRNERELANLQHWQLTCECYFSPEEWEWLFERFGYAGDYSLSFFE